MKRKTLKKLISINLTLALLLSMFISSPVISETPFQPLESVTEEEAEISESLFPIADAYVRGGTSANENFGEEEELIIRATSNNDNISGAFLKFELPNEENIIFTSAILKVYCSSLASDQLTISALEVPDDSWEETSLNWANMPKFNLPIASVDFKETEKYYEFNITNYVKASSSSDKISLLLFDTNYINQEARLHSREGKYSPKLEIKYKNVIPVEGISINENELELEIGDTHALNATIQPKNATNKTVKWSSSNPLIATVDVDGIVAGVSGGEAIITATSQDKGFIAKCTITISGEVSKTIIEEISPIDDAYVNGGSKHNTNFGMESELSIKQATDGEYSRGSYLKFQLPDKENITFTRAVLKVFCDYLPNGSPVPVQAFEVSDNKWTETEIVWANMPKKGNKISQVIFEEGGKYYEFDVTSFVKKLQSGDQVSLGLFDEEITNKDVRLHSKEGINKPILVLSYEETVNVESITIDKSDLSLGIGKTSPLIAKIYPDNATNKDIMWSSNNTSVAIVDKNGVVTGVSDGKAIITVTTEDGNKTDICNVEVISILTKEIIPEADTYVHGGNKDVNYGGEEILSIKGAGSDEYTRGTYLKFKLPNEENIVFTNAVLKVYCRELPNTSTIPSEGIPVKAFSVSDNLWEENETTWGNKPEWGTQIAKVNFIKAFEEYEFDITTYVSDFSSGDMISLYLMDNQVINSEVQLDSKEGKYSPTLEIKYKKVIPVEGMSINKREIEIGIGKTSSLVATIEPVFATNKNVNWKSDKPSVATVDEDGQVTGVAAGEAVVTATSEDGNFSAKCYVIVKSTVTAGETYKLITDPDRWIKELQEIGDVSPDEACTFLIEDDILQVGPWRVGEWAARYQYAEEFSNLSATISGYYKTEGTLEAQAQIGVYFKDSSGRILYKYKYQLANANNWMSFSLPIRRAPEGSKTAVVAFGNCVKNNGIVYYKDLQVSNTPWSLEFPEEIQELTRPAAPKDFEATKKWHLGQRDDTWWLVKPNGEAFYSLGLDLPYEDSTSVPTADNIDTLKEMNFNTICGWSDIPTVAPINGMRNEPVPTMITIENGTFSGTFDKVVSAHGERPDGHTMPDPYDPRWRAILKNKVETYKDLMDDKDWFIGYFTDNEISFDNLHRKVYSTNCSQAFKDWLSEKYNNEIGSLNNLWGTSYGSFDSLIAAKPDPAERKGPMFEDFYAFKRVLVKKYVDEIKAVFSEVYGDDMPLLFSNRFTVDLFDVYDIIDIYADAFDGIGFNCYPGSLQVGQPQYVINLIDKLYELTNKPILIGEWSVPSLDSGSYDNLSPSSLDFSFPECVDTQEERARQAAYVTSQFYNIPHIVGSHWFIWADYDGGRKANRGIFHADGVTPWPELKSALTNTQAELMEAMERIIPSAVEAAIDAIEALKEANEITLADEGDVAIARGLVNVAIAKGAEDSDITNLAKLAAAEAKIMDLKRPVIPTPPVTPSTPPETLKEPKMVVEKDKEGNVSVKISEIKVDTGKLPIIDISSLLYNEGITWNNPDLPVTITIDYTLTGEDIKDYEYLTVNYVDEDGNLVPVPNAKYNVKDGSISFITTKPGKFEVILEKKVFTDSGKLSWAQKPIEVLLSKGIIDKGEENYHPEAEITRGEFISMIVRALGLTANIKENFDDVKADNPYYQEIGIAKVLGIAKGVGNNNYDPDETISRQDMMVLINRALEVSKKLNIKGDISELNRMEDGNKVSEYAKQSIANLVKTGIIQGDGKRIMPKEYTNKASAAVVVYRILGL